MNLEGQSIDIDQDDVKIRHSLIMEIAAEEYGAASPLLGKLLEDIKDLYHGKWSTHQACQTGYHNHGHAVDVALLAARMAAGWNRVNVLGHPGLTEDLFLAAVSAALFHDTGYIKKIDDDEGAGGKYSFNHEERSMELATEYLKANNWPDKVVELVPKIISTTKFHVPLEIEGIFDTEEDEVIGALISRAFGHAFPTSPLNQ